MKRHPKNGLRIPLESVEEVSTSPFVSAARKSSTSQSPIGTSYRPSLIKSTEVTFHYTCRETKFGDRVAMAGNLALLGHWDPNRAVELTTTPDRFPVWTIKIDLPRDRVVEYKYLVLSGKGAKQTVEWESLPVNRLVDTHGKKEVEIFDKMDCLEQVEEYIEAEKKRAEPNEVD